MTPDELADRYIRHYRGISLNPRKDETLAQFARIIPGIARRHGALIVPLLHARLRSRMPWAYKAGRQYTDPVLEVQTVIRASTYFDNLTLTTLRDATTDVFRTPILLNLPFTDGDRDRRLTGAAPVIYANTQGLDRVVRSLFERR